MLIYLRLDLSFPVDLAHPVWTKVYYLWTTMKLLHIYFRQSVRKNQERKNKYLVALTYYIMYCTFTVREI